MFNTIEGNAASGGFFGFSMPILQAPVKGYASPAYTANPGSRPFLSFDGNTAHSAGWGWWDNGACIYTGGKLYHRSDGLLEYNTGRVTRQTRSEDGTADAFVRMTNTRLWLCNYGFVSWGKRTEVRRRAAALGPSLFCIRPLAWGVLMCVSALHLQTATKPCSAPLCVTPD